jgi:hypothetical protein
MAGIAMPCLSQTELQDYFLMEPPAAAERAGSCARAFGLETGR